MTIEVPPKYEFIKNIVISNSIYLNMDVFIIIKYSNKSSFIIKYYFLKYYQTHLY